MRISDWSSDVCSSDLDPAECILDILRGQRVEPGTARRGGRVGGAVVGMARHGDGVEGYRPIAEGLQNSCCVLVLQKAEDNVERPLGAHVGAEDIGDGSFRRPAVTSVQPVLRSLCERLETDLVEKEEVKTGK